MTDRDVHGTYSCAQRCKDGPDGKRCDKCKEAYSQYMRTYRALHPEAAKQARDRQYLTEKAARRVARNHPEEYKQELQKLKEKNA